MSTIAPMVRTYADIFGAEAAAEHYGVDLETIYDLGVPRPPAEILELPSAAARVRWTWRQLADYLLEAANLAREIDEPSLHKWFLLSREGALELQAAQDGFTPRGEILGTVDPLPLGEWA